jgi:hypothetical protein
MWMRRLFYSIALGCVIAGTTVAAMAGGAFLSVGDDLPLAPGLREVAGSAVAFDTPDGRIVEADAVGNSTIAALHGFYARTLPQLGWVPDGADLYRRDDETLRISPVVIGRERPGSPHLRVHFTVSPE